MSKAHTPTPWKQYSHCPTSIWSGEAQVAACKTVNDGSYLSIVKQETAEANTALAVASVNSYGKHCADPIAAAEADLLGQALDLLEFYAAQDDEPHGYGREQFFKARAILSQRKEK